MSNKEKIYFIVSLFWVVTLSATVCYGTEGFIKVYLVTTLSIAALVMSYEIWKAQ